MQNDVTFNKALTAHQNATFDRMLRAIAAADFASIVENMQGLNSLLALNVSATGSSGAVVSCGFARQSVAA